MIARDAVPIGHVPPLPRVDLNPLRPVTEIVELLDSETKAALWRMQMREAERVWRLVVQSSQGVAGG